MGNRPVGWHWISAFLIFQNLNQSVAHDWTSGLQKLILKKEDEIRAADRCRIQLQLPGKQDKSVVILITKLSKWAYLLGIDVWGRIRESVALPSLLSPQLASDFCSHPTVLGTCMFQGSIVVFLPLLNPVFQMQEAREEPWQWQRTGNSHCDIPSPRRVVFHTISCKV